MIARAKKNYWILYTVLFCIAFFFSILLWHILAGKSFIASYDSLDQHYIGYLYVGRWIRDLFKGLLVDHKLNFKMWEMGIGYGGDVFSTMTVYFSDPFYWLSAFEKPCNAELAFEFTIIVKIYLCGITYSLFSLEKGMSKEATLIGALVYTLAGSVYVGLLQTIFLSVMYLFPLVMLGIEKIWNDDDFRTYVFAVSLTFITYFYFAYMVCIFIFFYCIIRAFSDLYINKNIKKIIGLFLRFLFFSIISVGISCVFLLPAIIGLFNAGRLATDYYVPVLYDLDRYIDYFTRYFSICWAGMDSYIGVSAIAAPCIISLFMKKGNKLLKSIFVILTIGVMLPFFGWFMNGFGYVTNRWSWAYSFCLAYIVSSTIGVIREDFKDKFFIPIIFAIIYAIFFVCIKKSLNLEDYLILSLVTVICFLAAFSSFISEKIYWYVTITLTLFSVIIPGYFFLSDKHYNWLETELRTGEAFERINDSSALFMLDENQMKDEDRYDQYGIGRVRNDGWYFRKSGMSFYVSIYNENIDRFHNMLGVLTSPWAYGYDGLNSRSELEALMGVKYYSINEWQPDRLPYTYSKLVAESESEPKYLAFSSQNKVSLMYLFDKEVQLDAFEKLTPIQRQQLLMKAIIVDNDRKSEGYVDSENALSYEITDKQNVDFTSEGIEVSKEKGYLALKFDECVDSEIYVWFDNIRYEYQDESSYRIEVVGMQDGVNNSDIWAAYDGLNNRNHMYGGKTNWLINLGHSPKSVNSIRIVFNNIGKYDYDGIKIYSKEKAKITENIEGLNPTGQDIKIDNNIITATVRAESDQCLFISVPYSIGWRAYVDGKRCEIFKADIAFMGLELEKGEHSIVLRYRTPGLLLGFIISLLSSCILFAYEENGRWKQRIVKV